MKTLMPDYKETEDVTVAESSVSFADAASKLTVAVPSELRIIGVQLDRKSAEEIPTMEMGAQVYLDRELGGLAGLHIRAKHTLDNFGGTLQVLGRLGVYSIVAYDYTNGVYKIQVIM